MNQLTQVKKCMFVTEALNSDNVSMNEFHEGKGPTFCE